MRKKTLIPMVTMVFLLALMPYFVSATPDISINSPLNQTYYTTDILVNITQTEASPEMMWYSFPQGDWSMFRENLNNTGYTLNFNPPELVQLWNFTTGANIRSSSVVADGVVYTGSFDNNLYAVYLNGTQKWNYTTGGSIYGSTPAVADGVIYVGSNDNKLYAIYTNGTQKWNFTAIGFVGYSPPAVADGVVYFGIGDDIFYAVYTSNGTQKWSYSIPGGNQYASPAIIDGVVYTGAGNKLYAIYTNGTLKWSYTTGDDIRDSSPAVADGVIYVGSKDYKLYAIYTNGTQKWNYTTSFNIESSPAIADGVVYIGDLSGELHAVYLNGTQKWNYSTGSAIYSPAISNDIIYVGSGTRIFAIYTNGTQKWNYSTGGTVTASPSISNGMVFIGSYDDNFYAFGDGSVTNSLERTITLGYGTHEIEVISRNTSGSENTSTVFFTIAEPEIYYCDSCTSCTGYLQNLTNSSKVVMMSSSITDSSTSYCINMTGAVNGLTFDCDGYSVDGNDGASFGFYVFNPSVQTNSYNVQNCTFSDWANYGISIENTNAITMTNIDVYSNPSYGMEVDNSDNGVFTNFNLSYNANYPIFVNDNSDGSTFTNIECIGNTRGIYVHDSSDNLIFDYIYIDGTGVGQNGIFFDLISNNIQVRHSTISNSGQHGVFADGVQGLKVINTTINNSGQYGMYSSNSDTMTIENNSMTNNGNGAVRLINMDSSTIRNNDFQGLTRFENAGGSGANSFYNNLFNDTITLTGSANNWNTTLASGTNIIGGSFIAGNFFGNPSETGYSDTCSDFDRDGICDNSYTVASSNIDYLPLTSNIIAQVELSPPTPDNGTVVQDDYIYVNASNTVDNYDTCILEWNGANESITVSGMMCYVNKTGLAEDTYVFRVYANATGYAAMNATEERTITYTEPYIPIVNQYPLLLIVALIVGIAILLITVAGALTELLSLKTMITLIVALVISLAFLGVILAM